MRIVISLALVAGVVALAVVIGQRLSTDAVAVLVGLVFGVAAALPTALLVALATRPRRVDAPYQRDDYQPASPVPQIYVVQSGQAAPAAPPRLQLEPPTPWPTGAVIEAESTGMPCRVIE